MAKRSDPNETRIVIQSLARRIRANRAGGTVADGQLSVLFALDKHDELTPGRIAELERVTPPSINRTLGTLEEAGWIARRPDPDDARRVLIRLSDAGRELVLETRRLRTAWFTQRLDALSPEERRALDDALPVLRKLAES